MKEGRFHATMAAVALAIGLFSVYGLWANQLTVSAEQYYPSLVVWGFLLAGAAFYWWRREERLSNVFLMVFWGLLLGSLQALPVFIAARQNAGLHDALLARVDAALGIEVPTVQSLMEQLPALRRFLEIAYNMLLPLMALAIIVPPLCGRMDRAKEYAVSCLAAALISLPVFAVFQAVGPWAHYSFPPNDAQARYMRLFFALKAEGWFELEPTISEGLVTFPSFHTILAVLAALALRSTPYLRWPAGVLASLIALATVTTGWHYVADVVGGLLVAGVSVAVARGYLWLESGRQPAPSRQLAAANDSPEPAGGLSALPPLEPCRLPAAVGSGN
jgi:membrane-associated phospholipid phosphatase